MPFKEYEEFVAPPLQLPIRGKTYEIPPVSAEFGLEMLGALEGEEVGGTARQFWARLLGDAGVQMLADGVPYAAYDRAALAALIDFNSGREAAEKVWESGLPPEALAATMAAIREQQEKTTLSPSSASETETRSPASTSSMTSQKATLRAEAAASPLSGPKSSKTGRSSKRTG